MTTESVVPGVRPTRGSGLGGVMEDACVTAGDGPVEVDVDDMHAAKTDTAVAATIGMAMRARDSSGIRRSGEGGGIT